MDIRRNELIIYEIQSYLRELYKAGYDLPMITPDGIYGELTREAVKDFQALEGLPESGNVDFITWQRLISRTKEARESYALPEQISPFDMLMYDAAVSEGDRFDIIYIIQVMLRALHTYDYIDVDVNGIYDIATKEALADFAARNSIDFSDGQITKELWDALARAYSYHTLKNFKS